MSDRTGNIISTGTVTSKSTGEAAKRGLAICKPTLEYINQLSQNVFISYNKPMINPNQIRIMPLKVELHVLYTTLYTTIQLSF